jgi:hypothetical protein
MFEEWKRAWQEAVENFQRELNDASSDAPPRIRAMERELVSAAGALARLDEEIARARRALASERDAERVCTRRETLARDIGDDETMRVAAEFGARHAERAAVLERKVTVLEEEHGLLAADVEKMRRLVQEAAPAARVADGTTTAGPGSIGRDGDGEFSRLEQDARERAAAERLEELKRRMR